MYIRAASPTGSLTSTLILQIIATDDDGNPATPRNLATVYGSWEYLH